MTKLPNIPKSFRERAHGFAPFMEDSKQRAPRNLPPLPPERGGRQPRARRSLAGRLARITTGVIAASAVIGLFSLYLWLSELGVFQISDDTLKTVITQKPADNSIVYDRNGKKIGEFFNNYHVYVPYSKLPQHLVDAILAIEDRNFWRHSGYDLKAIARAAYSLMIRPG